MSNFYQQNPYPFPEKTYELNEYRQNFVPSYAEGQDNNCYCSCHFQNQNYLNVSLKNKNCIQSYQDDQDNICYCSCHFRNRKFENINLNSNNSTCISVDDSNYKKIENEQFKQSQVVTNPNQVNYELEHLRQLNKKLNDDLVNLTNVKNSADAYIKELEKENYRLNQMNSNAKKDDNLKKENELLKGMLEEALCLCAKIGEKSEIDVKRVLDYYLVSRTGYTKMINDEIEWINNLKRMDGINKNTINTYNKIGYSRENYNQDMNMYNLTDNNSNRNPNENEYRKSKYDLISNKINNIRSTSIEEPKEKFPINNDSPKVQQEKGSESPYNEFIEKNPNMYNNVQYNPVSKNQMLYKNNPNQQENLPESKKEVSKSFEGYGKEPKPQNKLNNVHYVSYVPNNDEDNYITHNNKNIPLNPSKSIKKQPNVSQEQMPSKQVKMDQYNKINDKINNLNKKIATYKEKHNIYTNDPREQPNYNYISDKMKRSHSLIKPGHKSKPKNNTSVRQVKNENYIRNNTDDYNFQGNCFACEVGCNISNTGYSPMTFSPYHPGYRRKAVTPLKGYRSRSSSKKGCQ